MPPAERESTPRDGTLGKDEVPRTGQRGRPRALGVVAAIGLVVTLLAMVLHRPASGPLGLLLTGPAAPAEWPTYRDPLGLFRVRLPPAWTAVVYMGEDSWGDRTGSATEPEEAVQVSDPALGAGSARFDVDATPIHTAFERHYYCQAAWQWWRTVLSFPIDDLSDATWLVDTANAHFRLKVMIPGVLGWPHASRHPLTPVPTATPLPPVTVAADLSVLSTIVGAFQPTNATALSCW